MVLGWYQIVLPWIFDMYTLVFIWYFFRVHVQKHGDTWYFFVRRAKMGHEWIVSIIQMPKTGAR